ncbi:MAG: Dabb family protein [Isosphaeraceae bacterium]
MLVHSVFFSLHDNSPAAIRKLIDACKTYLPRHDGVLHFSVGTLNRELDRPVNDRDFDVSLHLVFDSKASHDTYQVSPEHKQFIRESKPNWRLVRVFDSDEESK